MGERPDVSTIPAKQRIVSNGIGLAVGEGEGCGVNAGEGVGSTGFLQSGQLAIVTVVLPGSDEFVPSLT